MSFEITFLNSYSVLLDIKTVLNNTLTFVRVCMAHQEHFDFGVSFLTSTTSYFFEVYPRQSFITSWHVCEM